MSGGRSTGNYHTWEDQGQQCTPKAQWNHLEGIKYVKRFLFANGDITGRNTSNS